jgi:hypothetical protein
MSNSPLGVVFRRYAPFKTFGVPSFKGDGRTSASTSLQATSRTYGIVIFDGNNLLHNFSGSSGTHYDSLVWGRIQKTANIAKTAVRSTLHGPDLIEFEASTAGGNPLIPGSPDIDTFIKLRCDFGFHNPPVLRLAGEAFGDNFPNLEVFIYCYRSKNTALLIDGRTTGGRRTGPMTRLAGSHRNQSLGKITATLALTADGQLARSTTAAPTTM